MILCEKCGKVIDSSTLEKKGLCFNCRYEKLMKYCREIGEKGFE